MVGPEEVVVGRSLVAHILLTHVAEFVLHHMIHTLGVMSGAVAQKTFVSEEGKRALSSRSYQTKSDLEGGMSAQEFGRTGSGYM